MPSVVTAGMEGSVRAMSKIKFFIVLILIFLLETLNLYLGVLDTKMDYKIMRDLQEQTERHQMEDWIYDELDKSTWWYEGHTLSYGE